MAIEDEEDEAEERLTDPHTNLLSWSNLFYLLSICGSVRRTADQHALLKLTMTWLKPRKKVPSCRTVRRGFFPFLV